MGFGTAKPSVRHVAVLAWLYMHDITLERYERLVSRKEGDEQERE